MSKDLKWRIPAELLDGSLSGQLASQRRADVLDRIKDAHHAEREAEVALANARERTTKCIEAGLSGGCSVPDIARAIIAPTSFPLPTWM